MLKIKFRIVFSERIDSGNARVVFIFPNCSKDRVRYTKIFFVCRIVFRNISGFRDGTEIFLEIFSSKISFLASLIDLFEKKGPECLPKVILLTSFGCKLFKKVLRALFRNLTQWLRCLRKFSQSDCFLDPVKVGTIRIYA